MANLSFIEKEAFERLFNMKSGYVLDFTNQTFRVFIYDQLRIDIYEKYKDLSNAKMLRAIIAEYDDIIIGKLLLELLNYMKTYNMITSDNQELFKQCADIGSRLIGRKIANRPTKTNFLVINHDKYLKELLDLQTYPDSPQQRGFEFEKYLKTFFEDYSLEPRGSFKIEGEQIDGSFILNNEVYLLEAKWRNKPTDKGDLVIFNEKVSSKSGFILEAYLFHIQDTLKKFLIRFQVVETINIVLMTVQELSILLSNQRDFNNFLWNKVRALAEEGDFNKSIFEII